jgi:RNA polymerase sigma factor (sigma-70 family)
MKKRNEIIFSGLKLGDENAYNELYKHCYISVERFILKNRGTTQDAKDIFQDTMLILIEKIQSDNFELTATIDTYVYAVSKNLWLKKLRGISAHPEVPLTNLDCNYFKEEMMLIAEDEKTYLEKIKTLMAKLSAHCYHLLHSMIFENKGIKEVQKIFGYTTKHNAQNQKYKCVEQAKKVNEQTDKKNS